MPRKKKIPSKPSDEQSSEQPSDRPLGLSEAPTAFEVTAGQVGDARFNQIVELVRAFALIEDPAQRQHLLSLAIDFARGPSR